MTSTLDNIEVPKVPKEYVEKSRTLVKLYDDFVFTGESLDKLITELKDILMNAGFSKTQAMMKIAEDHKHLRKFSLNNIYKLLPKEEKSSRRKFSQNGKTLLQKNVTKDFFTPNPELEQFRQEKGKLVEPSDDDILDNNSTFAIPEEKESQQEIIYYDNPQKIIQQYEKRITYLSQPYDFIIKITYEGKDLYIIITAEPEEKTGFGVLDLKKSR